MNEEGCNDRRDLLRQLTLAGAGLALAAADPLRGDREGEEEEVAPAEDFRKIVSAHEYAALGEEFETKEHRLFGEDGFEKMVEKVAAIEKQLGIYELSQFTP